MHEVFSENSIQILARNSSGMAKDVELLEREFRKYPVSLTSTPTHPFGLLKRIVLKLGLNRLRRKRFGLNVYIQQPTKFWLYDAAINCCIPNQEWFTPWGVALLPQADEIWCKTHEAQRIFSALGCKCKYLGFTSIDQQPNDPTVTKNYRDFLHIGSNSLWKGTRVLVDTWCQHPEWPHLTVISRTVQLPEGPRPANVTLLSKYVPDEELLRLQNRCGIYIHPTEMEGFGHAICEAMSTSAVVIATDAAPMNELVAPDRGVLIEVTRATEKHHLGDRSYVTQEGLERAVESVLRLSDQALETMGRSGRKWYEDNDAAFKVRLRDIVVEHFQLPKTTAP